MKSKHIRARILQCLAIAECSNCPRAKHGCVIVDPTYNVVLQDSYNGSGRGNPDLCGGDCCLRDRLHLKSGENVQIGCLHAEFSCCSNAARLGIKLDGAIAFVTGEPCLMCAKMLSHTGISKVLVIKDGYSSDDGPKYLTQNNVKVEYVDKDGNLIETLIEMRDPPTVCKFPTQRFVKIGSGVTELTGDFE